MSLQREFRRAGGLVAVLYSKFQRMKTGTMGRFSEPFAPAPPPSPQPD